LPEGRNAIIIKEYLWPKGVVPYVFHSDYSKLLLKDNERKRGSLTFSLSNKSKNINMLEPTYFIPENYGVNVIICYGANDEMCPSY
jgi:hypothetical protein